ncbi:MAG: EAL domain-containing protein [Lachnospiraceae bacterium]|nr:EAL domain-containing protein [Lachnospiraceae bacterium]
MVNEGSKMARLVPNFGNLFNAGSVIFRADDERELIFVNDSIVRFYECDDPQDFAEYVQGHYDGLINPLQREEVIEDLMAQINEKNQRSGYVFYSICTKSGKNVRVVNHWSIFEDEIEGTLIYAWMFLHRLEDTAFEYDNVTGLFTKISFSKNVKARYKRYSKKEGEPCAIVYINLVNFKFLNIERGSVKGDECLKEMAELLREQFPRAVIARIADDHFALFQKSKDVMKGLQEVKRKFDEAYRDHYNLIGKFGVYVFETGQDLDLEEAISMAKMTCDFIKYDLKTDITEYSFRLAKQVMTKEYIIRKLEEALEKGWLKVYYQPVIRSLTGELCGMESLTRWIDPEIGFLPPNEFIETLEKEHLIHKVDAYVVEKVCQDIRERVEAGVPVVPVSVNFSRLDFVLCDMVSIVEKAVDKYDIPRDFIHIEITESMIASDENLMVDVIKRFRDAGFEIWMDDFGSGYSSLTMLKDYHFDTLKMDMRFLTPFNDKSKRIMRATVSMAKDVGMKTLAEGVETREQLDFLRDIGCGMIQGYYYGKPEPVKDVLVHLEEKQIASETRSWRQFYEIAGLTIRDTDTPLEIIEDDGENFRTLYMNRAYRRQIFSEEELDLDLEEIDRRIYQTASRLLDEYRKFADQIKKSGKQETFYYTGNGNYLCFTGQVIARNKGRAVIKGSLLNLSKDVAKSAVERLDSKLIELNHLFELVLWVKPNENTISPLLGNLKYAKAGSSGLRKLREGLTYLANEIILPADRERYVRFMDLDTLQHRIDTSEKGFLADIFQFKQKDGSYRQDEILLMRIPAVSDVEYLYCMKPYVLPDKESAEEDGKSAGGSESKKQEYYDIWDNILWKSRLMFFWKDTDRRFRGVSKSVLDYFGIKDEEQIIGKTEEELGWLADSDEIARLEENILSKGTKHQDQPIHVIVDGEVQDVVCTRMPLYDNGKIIGILGRFEDLNLERRKMSQKQRSIRTDKMTGLLNERAFKDSLSEFGKKHRSEGKEYGLILLNNTAHERIETTYDEQIAGEVLRQIASRLKEIAGKNAAIARTKDSVFALIVPTGDWLQIQGLVEEIRMVIGSIRQVKDKTVTLRLKMSYKIIGDEKVTEESIYETALKEVL